MIEFAVSDTGIGIAAEHLPALFSDFVQLDTRMQKRLRGTGLGLVAGARNLPSCWAAGWRCKANWARARASPCSFRRRYSPEVALAMIDAREIAKKSGPIRISGGG